MTTDIMTSTKVALNVRSNLKRHQTCRGLFSEAERLEFGVSLFEIMQDEKETDDGEALLSVENLAAVKR